MKVQEKQDILLLVLLESAKSVYYAHTAWMNMGCTKSISPKEIWYFNTNSITTLVDQLVGFRCRLLDPQLSLL